MRSIGYQKYSLYSFVLFFLGFILLWEWVLPLEEVLPVPLMLLFFAIVFLFSYFHIAAIITVPVYVLSMLIIIHSIHFEGSFFKMDWVLVFFAHLSELVESIISVQFEDISDISRTFLFLLFLCLFGYLLRIWLLYRRNAFPFIIVTIVYVAIVDTFTPYDATFAMIRIVIVGLLLIGMLQAVKLYERERLDGRMRFSSQWMFFVLIMIVFAAVIGFAAPKSGPQWPDPVPFLKGTANINEDEWIGNSRIKKLGYGENDEQLGGPFQIDSTPVFYADVDTVHYWRAETKDVYTGKGWQSSSDELQSLQGELTVFLYEENVKLDEKAASIEMTGSQPFTFLFYAGQPKEFIVNGGFSSLFVNPATGKIFTDNQVVDRYSFYYDYPTFSIEALKNSDSSYPSDIEQLYLQLPESLPERVKTLAENITKAADNPYDKAKAIETYFVGNGFSYETQNVAVPGPNDDYVDQFLFETKKGYCDNFSTAMVVMLRSIGIPARWVKGFTGGDFEQMLDDGKRRQLITNEHAHSWVEVYFPGSGWVPFEPTQGFVNSFSFVSSFDNEHVPLETEKEREQHEEKQSTETTKQNKQTFHFILNGKWIALICIVIATFGFILWKSYRRIAKRWIIYRLQKKPIENHFTEWYMGLLSVLKIYGYARKPEQTLREFARQIDEKLSINSMSMLTKTYEETIYSNRKQIDNINDLQMNWFKLVEKLSNIDRLR